MLTSLGKYLRKLRIDRGEILKNMADNLGVTSSFLSAVENGKKNMPAHLITLLEQKYYLTQSQKQELSTSLAETNEEITLNLKEVNANHRQIAVSFARKLDTFSDEQVEALQKIINSGD